MIGNGSSKFWTSHQGDGGDAPAPTPSRRPPLKVHHQFNCTTCGKQVEPDANAFPVAVAHARANEVWWTCSPACADVKLVQVALERMGT